MDTIGVLTKHAVRTEISHLPFSVVGLSNGGGSRDQP